MDISVLPNNNHPEKFLQLEVGTLPATHGMFKVGALMSSQKRWQNWVYFQREGREKRDSRSPEESPVAFVDQYLEKHISPLKFNVKMNPLFMTVRSMDDGDNVKSLPSWTVKEYDTQTMHSNLADYLKEEEKSPKELDFWLEDLYTPGFDSLLRKKEAEQKRKSLFKCFILVILSIFAVGIVIIVPVMVL